MKRTLLFTLLISLFAFTAHAQLGGDCEGCGTDDQYSNSDKTETAAQAKPARKVKISVYPNPAANFIGLSKESNARKILIFNVMGREAKSFKVVKGMKYDVSELKRGMYLVQILDSANKIITTQRLNKR